MSVTTFEPITLSDTEQAEVRSIEPRLGPGRAVLIGPSGDEVELPPTVYQVLREVISMMAAGKAITLVPDQEVVTTQRAADLLGVSRPFLIKLLDESAMNYHMVGNQRRVYLRDVLAYVRRRDHDRRAALAGLSREAFEAGLYDSNVMPEDGCDE